MKRTIYFTIALLLSAPFAFAAPKEKLPVAVLDFKESATTGGWGMRAADQLAFYLQGGLFNLSRWQPLKREDLAGRLATQKKYIGIDKYAGRKDLADTAKAIGVRYVFYGSFEDFRYAQQIRKTKKTVEVGTGQYETKRARKYGIAGPKEDRQVEIMKSAEVDTAVIYSEAVLQIAIGVLDAESGEPIFERLMEKTGEFEDKEAQDMIEELLSSICSDFVSVLRKRAGKDGVIVA